VAEPPAGFSSEPGSPEVRHSTGSKICTNITGFVGSPKAYNVQVSAHIVLYRQVDDQCDKLPKAISQTWTIDPRKYYQLTDK